MKKIASAACACLAAVVLAVLLYFASAEEKVWEKLAYGCMAMIPVLFLYHFIVPERIEARKTVYSLVDRVKPKVGENVKLIAYRHPFHGVCWGFRSENVYLYRFAGELTRGLEFMKRQDRVLDIEKTNEFILENRDKGGVLLILPNKLYSEDKGKLPKPRWVESNTKDRKGYSAVFF